MLSALIAARTASPMIITTGELAVGMYYRGSWSSMDSPITSESTTPTISAAAVRAANRQDCWLLTLKGKAIRTENAILPFVSGDTAHSGWFLRRTMPHVVWFGDRPTSKWKSLSTHSTREVTIVKRFLRQKSVSMPAPTIHRIVRVDLNSDGRDETLIYFGCGPLKSMGSELTGPIGNINPAFTGELLVSIQGGTEVVKPLYWETSNIHGDSSGLDAFTEFGGAWNLDGRPGLELISFCHRTYSTGARIIQFTGKGEGKVVAEAGGYRTGP